MNTSKLFIVICISPFFLKKKKIRFLDQIQGFKKSMDDNFKQLMEDELKIEELDLAVQKMSKGKSPGIDGITGVSVFLLE